MENMENAIIFSIQAAEMSLIMPKDSHKGMIFSDSKNALKGDMDGKYFRQMEQGKRLN